MPSWGSHPQAPSHGVNDPKVTGVLQRSPEDPHGEAEGAAGCTARGQRGHVPGAAGNRPRATSRCRHPPSLHVASTGKRSFVFRRPAEASGSRCGDPPSVALAVAEWGVVTPCP